MTDAAADAVLQRLASALTDAETGPAGEARRPGRSAPAIVTAAMRAMPPAMRVPGRAAATAAQRPEGIDDLIGEVTFAEAEDERAEAASIAATIDRLPAAPPSARGTSAAPADTATSDPVRPERVSAGGRGAFRCP